MICHYVIHPTNHKIILSQEGLYMDVITIEMVPFFQNFPFEHQEIVKMGPLKMSRGFMAIAAHAIQTKSEYALHYRGLAFDNQR